MAEPSMEDVLDLIGRLLEDATDTKDRLREFLLKDKWQPEHFDAWLKECMEEGDSSHRFWYKAMQDVAVAIGSRLGFEVEFGRYSGSVGEIAYDGLWRSKSGTVTLVEVKASGWPVTTVGQLGEYVNRYAQSPEGEGLDVYGLYVVGSADVQHLIDQIKGGQYRNQLRLISFENLVKLWRLKADLDEVAGPDAAATRIQSVILPIESVDVGNLVTILLEIAELKSAAEAQKEGNKVPPTPPEDSEEPWEREELHTFLSKNTDWQNAFLTVLAFTEEERVFTDRVVRLMAEVAERHFPRVSGRALKSVAGVRAGFTMRRGSKQDFIGADWVLDGERWQGVYWLRPRYKEWVKEWVSAKGWSMPTVSSN